MYVIYVHLFLAFQLTVASIKHVECFVAKEHTVIYKKRFHMVTIQASQKQYMPAGMTIPAIW
jgi:hypothetical protein